MIGIVLQRIGVRGCGLTDRLLDGIATECAHHKLGQVLGFYEEPNEFRKLINSAHQMMVDGFIIGSRFSDSLIPDMLGLQRSGTPVVTVYSHPIHRSLVNVGIDQVGIGRVATEHLIEQGCRRIVHLRAGESRLVGYRQALREGRIGVRDEWVHWPGFVGGQWLMPSGGEEGINHLLDAGVEFDGVFASSDPQGMGTIRALLKAGRRVPEDVKVVGVDNSPLCDSGYVTLTSVSDDARLRGRLAVRALLDCCRGRSVKSLALEPMLVARESTRS